MNAVGRGADRGYVGWTTARRGVRSREQIRERYVSRELRFHITDTCDLDAARVVAGDPDVIDTIPRSRSSTLDAWDLIPRAS